MPALPGTGSVPASLWSPRQSTSSAFIKSQQRQLQPLSLCLWPPREDDLSTTQTSPPGCRRRLCQQITLTSPPGIHQKQTFRGSETPLPVTEALAAAPRRHPTVPSRVGGCRKDHRRCLGEHRTAPGKEEPVFAGGRGLLS